MDPNDPIDARARFSSARGYKVIDVNRQVSVKRVQPRIDRSVLMSESRDSRVPFP